MSTDNVQTDTLVSTADDPSPPATPPRVDEEGGVPESPWDSLATALATPAKDNGQTEDAGTEEHDALLTIEPSVIQNNTTADGIELGSPLRRPDDLAAATVDEPNDLVGAKEGNLIGDTGSAPASDDAPPAAPARTSPSSTLWSALHLAAATGDLDTITKCLEAGEDVNSRTNNDWTPLHKAAQCRQLGSVQTLLKAGADVSAATTFGRTPLHVAAANGATQCLVELITQGDAKVDAVEMDRRTPLHRAAFHGHLNCCLELIARGANVNARDKDGRSPLHFAVVHNNLDCMKEILRLGGDLHVCDNAGLSLLHYAADNDRVECVEALLALGVDAYAKSNNGLTPLDYGSSGTQNAMKEYVANHATDDQSSASLIMSSSPKVRALQALPFILLFSYTCLVLPFVWRMSQESHHAFYVVLACAILLVSGIFIIMLIRMRELWAKPWQGDYIQFGVLVICVTIYIAAAVYADHALLAQGETNKQIGKAIYGGHIVFLAMLSGAVSYLAAGGTSKALPLITVFFHWFTLVNSFYLFYAYDGKNVPTAHALYMITAARLFVFVAIQILFSLHIVISRVSPATTSDDLAALPGRNVKFHTLHGAVVSFLCDTPTVIVVLSSGMAKHSAYTAFAVTLNIIVLLKSLIVYPVLVYYWQWGTQGVAENGHRGYSGVTDLGTVA